MSEIRKQSLECPVRHGQPVGRQNVQELLGRELPENADDFDCFDESDEDRTSLRPGRNIPPRTACCASTLSLRAKPF